MLMQQHNSCSCHFAFFFCIDNDQRLQNHLYPSTGLNLGFSVFSRNQDNRGSLGAYFPWSERDDEQFKMPHGAQRSWTLLFCVYFFGRQKPEDPEIEAHGWDFITQDGIGDLGLWYICDFLCMSVFCLLFIWTLYWIVCS